MSTKNMRTLGVVGSIVGAIILIFGLSNYNNAKDAYKAASWFGETDTSQRWSGYMDNYKIFIIVGAIILAVFLILAIAGIINTTTKSTSGISLPEIQNNVSVSEKVSELKKMLDNNLITQEGFESKRKEIIDKM